MAEVTGLPVFLVQARSYDWMLSVSRTGWVRLLRLLDQTVQQALTVSQTGKVTVVGHSAAGVLSRMYLSPEPFEGHGYGGYRVVDHLITLGSPHYSQAMHGAQLRQWVDERYPGAYFGPQVKYTTIAGKMVYGNRRGTFWERFAYRAYNGLTGVGDDWGDGLVPRSSALLEGTRQITLEGAAHFWGFLVPWYGTREVVARWWDAAWSNDDRCVA